MALSRPKLSARLTARLGDLRAERGSALIEVMVSAVILVVAATALSSALNGASASSGRAKGRSIAAQLAEQDQERMRGKRFVDLSNYTETRNQAVAGVTYKVVSDSDWIRDATGGTESCVSNSKEADYIRIRSTVTSPTVGKATKPVVLESLVAPPVAAFKTAEGTLGIALKNRIGEPLSGVAVTVNGPKLLTDMTNSAGCAVFSYIPTGTYTISLTQAGWVTGKELGQGTVQEGKVAVVDVQYDRAASVTGHFYTKLPNAAGTLVDVAAQGWHLSAAKKGTTPTVFAASPAPGPVASISATNLFPWTEGYGMFSGNCADNATTLSNDPTKSDPAYYDKYPGYVKTDPGLAYDVNVLQPATKVLVRQNTGTTAAPVYVPVAGAHVVARSTSSGCKDAFPGFTTDINGYVTKTPTTDIPYDPSLPFGQYKICADLVTTVGSTKTTKSASVTVNNTNPLAPDAKTLTLATGSVCT
jgi:Tfp pilus assembly protein PilV